MMDIFIGELFGGILPGEVQAVMIGLEVEKITELSRM